MKKNLIHAIVAAVALTSTTEPLQTTHLVSLTLPACVTDSKLGKEEQSAFENLKQMTDHLETTEKQLMNCCQVQRCRLHGRAVPRSRR
jgi:hypothetical protein